MTTDKGNFQSEPTPATVTALVSAIAQATGRTRQQVEREIIRGAVRRYARQVLGPGEVARVENASTAQERQRERERQEHQAARQRHAANRERIRKEWVSGKYPNQKALATALSLSLSVVNDCIGGVRPTRRLEEAAPRVLELADGGATVAEIVETIRGEFQLERGNLGRQVRKIIRQRGEFQKPVPQQGSREAVDGK